MDYKATTETIKQILALKHTRALQDVVELLQMNFKHYSWVGIYVVKGNTLILGPWQGKKATEHISIPIGKGVCGAAAASGKTEVVSDVSKDSRYLSCFLSTRSEIVVPIKKNKAVVGEIDIDSDTPAAFHEHDKKFLEKVAEMLSPYIS